MNFQCVEILAIAHKTDFKRCGLDTLEYLTKTPWNISNL